MGVITSSSKAAATTSSIKNVQFITGSEVVPANPIIIGTGDPAKEAGIDLDTPILVTSPEDAANKTGAGFMLHRLTKQFYKGSKNQLPVTIIMQAEDGAGAQASGSIDFVGSSGVLAGTLKLYISGLIDEPVGITVTAGDAPADLAAATAAAINALTDLPVTASAATTITTITAKSKGAWGNDIDISFNLLAGDVTPTGVVGAITGMSAGAATDDISTALNALGTGDGANEDFYTDLVHGYGQDSTQLNHISVYGGEGNDAVGLYDEFVHKPFRSLNGDTAAGSGGLSALVSLGDGRKLDRTNGTYAVPGSATHPQEIAAQVMGMIARIANINPAKTYAWQALSGVDPGAKADRWTSENTNRNTAVLAGISPSFVEGGIVKLQNVVSYYHPDNVTSDSNGYRSMRDLAITRNLLDGQFKAFRAEKWEGVSFVADKSKVTNSTSREKARDLDDVLDTDLALAKAWEGQAWIFTADFTVDQLKINPPTLRGDGKGFNNQISVIYSGEGLILDSEVQFDVSPVAVTG